MTLERKPKVVKPTEVTPSNNNNNNNNYSLSNNNNNNSYGYCSPLVTGNGCGTGIVPDSVEYQKDHPINSRNTPSTLNILTCSMEKEDFANSLLRLDSDGVSVEVVLANHLTPTCVTKSAPIRSMMPLDGSSVGAVYGSGGRKGFFDGVFGCLRPVLTFIGKATAAELKSQDNWEIPFENISDLKWLGSGTQGAVFLGKLNQEQVAVKKVRDVKETDIRHLRKLNHPNIISFKGICTQAPCYCIVMEFCPYGQLYEILRDDRHLPQGLLFNWVKQICNGMTYMHLHKIIHRDLKSPNILVTHNDVIKISDFGTSREWSDKSTKMSFAGTVAWMAPEVIRNEPCSEKVDVWSYGVVLWELMTHEVPYRNVDSSAVIWGVGSNSLHLPIPSSCPDGFKLLMNQCWSTNPRNRPTFRQIQMHLEIALPDLLALKEDEFYQLQSEWKTEISEQLQIIQTEGCQYPKLEEELIKRRKEELRHAQDVREHYERKLDRANNLYIELTNCMLQLEKREQELIRREQLLHGDCKRQKSIVQPIVRAQEMLAARELQISEQIAKLASSADFVPKKETVSFAVEKGHERSADLVTSSSSRGRLKGRSCVSNGKDVPHSATSSPCKNPRKFGTETDPQSARRGSLTLGRQDAARSLPRAGEFCSSKTWQRLDRTAADGSGTKSREAVESKQAAAEQRNLNRSKSHSRSRESNFGADVDGNGIPYETKTGSNDANLDTDDSANVACWPSWPERIGASDYGLGSSEPRDRHGGLERDSDNGNQLCGSLGTVDLDNGPLKSRSRSKKFKRAGSFGNTLDGSPSKKAETGLPFEEVIKQESINGNVDVTVNGRKMSDSQSNVKENIAGDSLNNFPEELVSSIGSDNFNIDVMISSTSDSLSEKENIVQQMKNKMKYSSKFLSVPSFTAESSFSESEELLDTADAISVMPVVELV